MKNHDETRQNNSEIYTVVCFGKKKSLFFKQNHNVLKDIPK